MKIDHLLEDQRVFNSLRTVIEEWVLPESLSENQKKARLVVLAGFAIRANELGQDGITLDEDGQISKVWTELED